MQLLLNNGNTSVYNAEKKLPCFCWVSLKERVTETLCLVLSWTQISQCKTALSHTHVRRIYEKAMELGTVLNVNNKTSPGNSLSGRSRHVRTPRNVARVAAVMNRDAAKHIGDRNSSPVSFWVEGP